MPKMSQNTAKISYETLHLIWTEKMKTLLRKKLNYIDDFLIKRLWLLVVKRRFEKYYFFRPNGLFGCSLLKIVLAYEM